MAETQTKRHRDEEEEETHNNEETKRHKSYNQILSFLEEDEIEPNEDLSSIFTSLQQELSNDDFASLDPLLGPSSDYGPGPQAQTMATDLSSKEGQGQGDEEKESVIRHLLEASDDELGIPNRVDGGDDYQINGGDLAVSFGDGLWEFEDEAANYYTLLQSELLR